MFALAEGFVRIVAKELVEIVEQKQIDELLEEVEAAGTGLEPGSAKGGSAAFVVAGLQKVFANVVFGFEFGIGQQKRERARDVEHGMTEGGFFEIENAGDFQRIVWPGKEDITAHEIQVEWLPVREICADRED